MLSGAPLSAEKALTPGILDAISENSLIEDAIEFFKIKLS